MHQENKNQIIKAMVKDGYSEEEIAKELDMSKGHINKIKRELGLTVNRRYAQDDAQTIIDMFKQGYDKSEIADKLGWTKGTISEVLRRNGFGKQVPEELEEPPVIVPKRKVIKPEMVIDKSNGKIYYDVTPFFLNMEGMRVWNT
jgi:IS30 family transposase